VHAQDRELCKTVELALKKSRAMASGMVRGGAAELYHDILDALDALGQLKETLDKYDDRERVNSGNTPKAG